MNKLAVTRRNALATAALLFGLLAPLTYEAERVYERLRSGRTDPTMVVSEIHAGFYWRAGLAAWWAGLIAAIAYRLLCDRPSGTVRPSALVVTLLALTPVLAWLTYRFP